MAAIRITNKARPALCPELGYQLGDAILQELVSKHDRFVRFKPVAPFTDELRAAITQMLNDNPLAFFNYDPNDIVLGLPETAIIWVDERALVELV